MGPSPVPGLTAHIVITGSHTIPAGSSVSGKLIVENTTKAPISVDQGCSGEPQFGVVLTSSAVPQSAAFTAVRCEPVVLSPGIHRYPFVLSTTYQGCVAAGGSGSTFPPCKPGNQVPPLQAGRYRAAMSTMSPIPVAKSIAVRVIEAVKHPVQRTEGKEGHAPTSRSKPVSPS